MMNRKRQPAKTTRQWMELIRECANQRGSFSMRDMLQRHNFRGPSYSVAVRKAMPISGHKHSFWSGPKPKDEAELRVLAERATNAYYEIRRRYNESSRGQADERPAVPARVWIAQPAPQVVMEPKANVPNIPRPKARAKEPAKRRKRVSILWGLISWG